MQFADQLQSFITSVTQDKKKLIIVVGGVGVLLVVTILAGVVLNSGSGGRAAQSGTNANTTVNSTTGSSGGFGFGTKSGTAPTLAPTKTPEEIAYLTAIPAAPTDIPFITKKDLDELTPHGSPTPTPLPGIFYTPNGLQNDLEIRYYYENAGDSFDQIRVVNTKTTEERTFGYIFHYTPGDPAFFSKDFSQIYFIGGSKSNYNQISIYNIAKNKIEKAITLEDMKKAMPQFQIDESAVLSMLQATPNKSKMAFSYGNTFSTNRIVPDTKIIVINIVTNKMQLLPVKGLVRGWKDDTTLLYEVNTADPNVNNTLEIAVQ